MAPDGREYERRHQALSSPDTIYALSSGNPPAALAVVRISGAAADAALMALAGRLPPPRRASLVALHDQDELLDRALALRFPGSRSATGEDLVELHLHGGRAVVAAVLAALARQPGLRAAEPGEFTRRAFLNGRIDLAEAEGLADLLEAETEWQRKSAMRLADGALSRRLGEWTDRLLALAAQVEAQLDFADEGDVGGLSEAWHAALGALSGDIAALLSRPAAERLRDGIRVVIGGPPNAGKSTLLNALVGREAAITSDIAGTTRDLVEVPVALAGIPFLFTDTAGLRDEAETIEAIGISRAQAAIAAADIVLWLGDDDSRPEGTHVLQVYAKADLGGEGAGLAVSAVTGTGMAALVDVLLDRARSLLPGEGEVAVNARQRAALHDALHHIDAAAQQGDLLIVAEELRSARQALDRVTGRAGVEDMLDALFGRFCIGK